MMEQSGLLKEKKTDIKSLTLPELTAEMEAMGEKKFRAGQLYQWMHQKLAGDYEEMTNIPAALKENAGRDLPILPWSASGNRSQRSMEQGNICSDCLTVM